VFKSGVRGVMLVLSLLVLGGGDEVQARGLAVDQPGVACPAGGIMAVSASAVSASIDGVKTIGSLNPAGRIWLEPSTEADLLAAQSPKTLPGMPRPVLLMLIGLLCVSLVRNRCARAAAAASAFSVARSRPGGGPMARDDAPENEHWRLVGASLVCRPRWTGPIKADVGFCSARSRSGLRQEARVAVAVVSAGMLDRLTWWLDSVANRALSLMSRWIIARLARGPPAGA
jgi:hypothetical protein